jgi:hypothetical protein
MRRLAEASLSELSHSVRRPRWDPSDPWAATVIAMGERCRDDFEALAKSVLGINAIFASDFHE